MWTLIKKILPEKIRKLGLQKEVKWQKLQQDWDEILKGALGPEWQGKSRPIKLKNKVLIVICLNSVWANELQMKKEILLKEIRPRLKEVAIEEIKIIS